LRQRNDRIPACAYSGVRLDMTISPATTVGALATRFPATIGVFQRLGIAFCCEGWQPLGAVCEKRQLVFRDVATMLSSAIAARPPRKQDWTARPLSELTAHIIEAFHEPLRQELPRLVDMAVAVQAHADGAGPVLEGVLEQLLHFSEHLRSQMDHEEGVLFPLVERLERGDAGRDDCFQFPRLRAGSEFQHVRAGQMLRMLRTLTRHYAPPAGACTTVRGLFSGLFELERLMQLHVHMENNLLLPRAEALLSEVGTEKS
jgi:regulator of cell morphogenesis and NO signaling